MSPYRKRHQTLTPDNNYQARHRGQLAAGGKAWGAWSLPEPELQVLGEVVGRDVLELGCGAAQGSIDLARAGARPVGLDLSEGQLGHARRLLRQAGVQVSWSRPAPRPFPWPTPASTSCSATTGR
jgi:2-polyprenyl-3-methyl-5-hydroxy-6-metoxy-1,4-benzoquinol methylase